MGTVCLARKFFKHGVRLHLRGFFEPPDAPNFLVFRSSDAATATVRPRPRPRPRLGHARGHGYGPRPRPLPRHTAHGHDHGHGLCHGPQPTAWPRPRPRHGHGHGRVYVYIHIYICRHLGSRYIASLWAKCLGDTVDRWNGGFLPTDQSIDRSTDTLIQDPGNRTNDRSRD